MSPAKNNSTQSPLLPPTTRGNRQSRLERNNNNEVKLDEESVKYVLHVFDEKFASFREEILTEIGVKNEKIDELEQQVVNLKKSMQSMQERLEDAEAYNRREDLILSGRAVSSNVDSPDTVSLVKSILKNKLKYELPDGSIISSRRLGPKPVVQGPDKRKILVRMNGMEVRDDIVKACKLAKPTDLYVNDNLTQIRARILYALRQAKKRKPALVSGCGSQNGRVFVWIASPNQEARNIKVYLNSWEKFKNFCGDSLDLDVASLMDQTSD